MLPIQFDAKIWKQGNSLIVTIPKEMRERYNLKGGDNLRIFAGLISEEELEREGEIMRIKASYPQEATGVMIHKDEEVSVLSQVFFRNFECKAGTLSPGESPDNLPLIKSVLGIIYFGYMLPSAIKKKHYPNYVLKDDKIRIDLLFSETIKLKTLEGKEIIIKGIKFEDPLPLQGHIKKIKFYGHLEE